MGKLRLAVLIMASFVSADIIVQDVYVIKCLLVQ